MNEFDVHNVDDQELGDPDIPETSFQVCGFSYGVRPISGLTLSHRVLNLPVSLTRAVPKRQAEFLAGRYCAHQACESLGVQTNDLPIGADRAPVWPSALVGSITHTDGIAAALVGPANRYRGLGLDVEGVISDASIDALQSLVVVEGELAVLDSFGGERQALTALFSAKEAIYKAIHPTVKRYVDFKEVHCQSVDSGRLFFSMGKRLAEELPDLTHIAVHVSHSNARFMTWCVID